MACNSPLHLQSNIRQIGLEGLHLVQKSPGQGLDIAIQAGKVHHAGHLRQDHEAGPQIRGKALPVVFVLPEPACDLSQSGPGSSPGQQSRAGTSSSYRLLGLHGHQNPLSYRRLQEAVCVSYDGSGQLQAEMDRPHHAEAGQEGSGKLLLHPATPKRIKRSLCRERAPAEGPLNHAIWHILRSPLILCSYSRTIPG